MLGGQLVGPPEKIVRRPVPADSDDPDGIAFAQDQKYLDIAERSGVGAMLVASGMSSKGPHIVVGNPQAAFGMLLHAASRPLPIAPGIHPTAVIDPLAKVHAEALIGPYAVIERGAVIGARSRVYPFAYIGEDCVLGEDCAIYPHVVLYQQVRLGDRCMVHAGTVLGADGFRYNFDGNRQVKVPHVGGVKLGDDVEVGALTAVDRATAGETSIGDDTKIDNLVQVAHNVRIGRHTVVAGLTGISGSTSVGDRVTIAGNVGFADHVTVGDDVTLGARTGVGQDILEKGVYFGEIARPIREATRAMMLRAKLPELFDRLKKLEREMEALKKDPD